MKLIAEPWDLGEGGYQVGNFPIGWAEWNGKYRDTVRRFWKGDGGMISEMATRLAGSSDLYAHSGRRIRGGEVKDITWFDPNGGEMSDRDWNAGFARSFAVRLVGTEIEETDRNGDPIVGDTLFLMFNAHHDAIPFVLSPHDEGLRWQRLLDTSRRDWATRSVPEGLDYLLPARSVAVFRIVPAFTDKVMSES